MRVNVAINLDPTQATRLQALADQSGVTLPQMAAAVAVLALNHHLGETPRSAGPIAQRIEQATQNGLAPSSNPGKPTGVVLPDTGFLRLSEIVGRPARRGQPPPFRLVPVSRSTWLAGVKSGRFPQPVKLGPAITAWRVEDLRALLQSWGRGTAAD